jgi:hypothetical protein
MLSVPPAATPAYPLTPQRPRREELHRRFAPLPRAAGGRHREVNDDGTVNVTEPRGGAHAGAQDEADDAATGAGCDFIGAHPAFPKLSQVPIEGMGLRPGSQFVTYFDPRKPRAPATSPRRQARRRLLSRAKGRSQKRPWDRTTNRGFDYARSPPAMLRQGRRRHLPVRDDALQRRVLRRPPVVERGRTPVHLALPMAATRRWRGACGLQVRTTPARAS